MGKISSGEMHVWNKLAELDPSRVCRTAKVTFDAASAVYILSSFGYELGISLKDRQIFAYSNKGAILLLNKLGNDLCLTALYYLISAKDIPISNRLIKPASLPGGQIFVKGSHVLPLDEVASKYDGNPPGFIERGETYGGQRLSYGDASVRFLPFPRIPVVLILRTGDEEFPANVDILLDDTCSLQIPTDIIWSTCMLNSIIML